MPDTPTRLPAESVKRVERPTTRLTDGIRRIDMRSTAYGLAARGEYGPAVQRAAQSTLPEKYPLSAAQKDVIDHLALIPARPIADREAPLPRDPAILTHHVKALGYFLRADIMAACRVPTSAYYSHDKQGTPIQPRFEHALIIVMRKDLQAVQTSAGRDWMGDPISFQAYQHLGMVAETIAKYIRCLGWNACPQYGPSFGNRYAVLLPPLLLPAGIGEVSRAGIILNPFLGLAFKAAAVLTDLPLVPDQPVDFGLQRFCKDCTICAQACPSKATSMCDKRMYNGYGTWKLDTHRCASINFTNGHGTVCNTCVKSCPWSSPSTFPANMMRSLVIDLPFTRPIAIWIAEMLAERMTACEQELWFDMEYLGDVLDSREDDKNRTTDQFRKGGIP